MTITHVSTTSHTITVHRSPGEPVSVGHAIASDRRRIVDHLAHIPEAERAELVSAIRGAARDFAFGD